MIATLDVGALVTLVGAVSAAIVSIIVAWRQTATHAALSTVKDAVQMTNGQTIAQAVEQSQARDAAQDAKPPTP